MGPPVERAADQRRYNPAEQSPPIVRCIPSVLHDGGGGLAHIRVGCGLAQLDSRLGNEKVAAQAWWSFASLVIVAAERVLVAIDKEPVAKMPGEGPIGQLGSAAPDDASKIDLSHFIGFQEQRIADPPRCRGPQVVDVGKAVPE